MAFANLCHSNDNFDPMDQQKYQRIYPDQCAVCGQKCQYFHYEVRCCEGCKHFFRRSVSLKKEYCCAKNSVKCDITSGKGPKCKKCRLDKCILVGMDARGVGSRQHSAGEMVDFVDKRRRELAKRRKDQRPSEGGGQMVLVAVENKSANCSWLLCYLMEIERRVRRIRNSRTRIPDFFYDQCTFFEQILETKLNLIESADEFSNELPVVHIEGIIADVKHRGPFCVRPPYLAMDLLFAVEIAKTMPFFGLLEARDQVMDKICLLSNVAMPLYMLCNGFYSWQQKADTFSTPMGYTPIQLIGCVQKYQQNKLAMKLGTKALCDVMVPFARAELSTEEFVLLRAIIYSHMVASGLSENAQQILVREAGKYSEMLMNLLQCKLGPCAGARRYAELLLLVEFCFNSGAQHRQWLTFVANVMECHQFGAVMPPLLVQLCTRGPIQLPQLAPL